MKNVTINYIVDTTQGLMKQYKSNAQCKLTLDSELNSILVRATELKHVHLSVNIANYSQSCPWIPLTKLFSEV